MVVAASLMRQQPFTFILLEFCFTVRTNLAGDLYQNKRGRQYVFKALLYSLQYRGACDFVDNFDLRLKAQSFVAAKDFSCRAA
jgi:hypothetical protein